MTDRLFCVFVVASTAGSGGAPNNSGRDAFGISGMTELKTRRYLPNRILEHYAVDRKPGALAETDMLDRKAAAKSSLALSNMRALVILTVLAFHSVLAYLGSLGPAAFPFDDAPYKWRAFPIVDSHRWFGFDIFCAWQDVYLMSLMFFLSALFTWPSLTRKGSWKFLSDRFLRLGVPFAFALIVVMPLALYPVYRVTAVDPSLAAYWRHLLALPFWPNGPMWFLWQLLALTVVAAGLHRFVPHWVEALGRWSSSAGIHPGRYFIGLVTASAIAYVPLALVFTPWIGPITDCSLSSSAARCTTRSITSPVLGSAPSGSSAACSRPRECWRGGWAGWLALALALPGALDGADRPADDRRDLRIRSACGSPSISASCWLARVAAFS